MGNPVKLNAEDQKVYKTPITEGQIYVDPGKKVIVNLPRNDDREEDEQFEWVNIAGLGSYQVRLGEPVEVPYEVFMTLYESGRYKMM